MIAKRSESNHNTEFIGKTGCFLPSIADIQQQRSDNDHMKEIDPGIRLFLAQPQNILIGLVGDEKDTEAQNGRIGPVRHLVLKEGNHEEEGRHKEDVKKG